MDLSKLAESALSNNDEDADSFVKTMKGLDYFRRRRPYVLSEDDQGGWKVYEVRNLEMIGRIARTHDELGPYIEIDVEQSPDASQKLQELVMAKQIRDLSIHDAADHVWRSNFRIKSMAWRIMRGLVHGYDWLMSLLDMSFRLALVALAAYFVIGLVPFFWEARDIIQEVVLQWLDGFRDKVFPPA